MAETKISELPSATVPLTGGELVAVVQSSVTEKVTAQDIANVGQLLSSNSRLVGRGSANGAGPAVEILIGAGLVMSGTTLNATGGGGGGGGGDALTTNPLSQFAATSSSQLKSVLTDETGSGQAVFSTSPVLVNPIVGTQPANSNNDLAASTSYVDSKFVGSGTVSSFAFANVGGFTGIVLNPTTTPTLSLTYSAAFQSLTTTGTGNATLASGVLNVPPQNVQALTTTGTGAATLSGGVLNIPTSTGSTGTVTSVSTTGTRVTGTVTNSTTTPNIALALANTTVTPGTYTNANITVQADGTITNASNGSGGGGALGIPQNSQSGPYTLVLADQGYHIYHPPSDTPNRTWTIPANATVAFPIGSAITFDNDYGAGNIVIVITSDTLVWVGPVGSTGTRTLASGGQATLLKVGTTRWRISGVGLS